MRFTDKEYFDYEMKNGIHNDNPNHIKVHDKLAKYVKEELKANSLFEIGCGTGAFLECCLKRKINAYGYEPSLYHKDYWDKRHPANRERMQLEHVDLVFADVVVCIEVFEHITIEECREHLNNIQRLCKYFIFSSTPYFDTPEFDEQWGHINLNTIEFWINLIESYGFKMKKTLGFPTEWTMLFELK